MARDWRLTQQAEDSLLEIVRWTLETFGPKQADAYHGDLIACCEAIAAGETFIQSCRERIDPALAVDLSFARSGMHLVIFTVIDDVMIVVDFIHQQSDVPRRLRDMPKPNQH